MAQRNNTDVEIKEEFDDRDTVEIDDYYKFNLKNIDDDKNSHRRSQYECIEDSRSPLITQ
jgi:hypothetical protein